MMELWNCNLRKAEVMAAENKSLGEKVYIFKRCLPCGIKLHLDASICNKCGKRIEEKTYGSHDSDDAIFNQWLNDYQKCIPCRNTQNEDACKFIYCYGRGGGNCQYCNDFYNTRFMCCQEKQKSQVTHDAV